MRIGRFSVEKFGDKKFSLKTVTQNRVSCSNIVLKPVKNQPVLRTCRDGVIPEIYNKEFYLNWLNSNELNYNYLDNIDGPEYLEINSIICKTNVGIVFQKIKRIFKILKRIRIKFYLK